MTLFLGAHPDDIELGCGGYIASKACDPHAYIFSLESSFPNMIKEVHESFNYLEITHYKELGNFKVRNFHRQDVLDMMLTLKSFYKPKVVFTHSSFDCHQDHKVIHEETVRAFKDCTILGYNLPHNNVKGNDFRYYKTLDSLSVSAKLKALKFYKSQENRSYFDWEYQKALMRVTGQEIGQDWAEKFEIIRWID